MSSVGLAAQRERGGKVEGGRRLADAAFLIRDGEDHLRIAADRPAKPDTRRGTECASF